MPETSDLQSNSEIENPKRLIQLESMHRIANMPYVGSTINKTTEMYERIKESNLAAKLILESTEHSVQKVASLAEPMVTTLEKPIKIADNLFCSTIDFVEENVPKVIETQQKISSAMMSSVPVQPAVECVKAVGSYGVQKVNHLYSQIQSQNTQNDETVRKTEPEKHDQETQTDSNVRYKVKMFSQK